ncbi:MAG: hypothetical protein A2270_00525 [Elusimicrobia bacterium RIFOXYA12_FULL_51_18]|nr:MAG: hypothetical protein A2270_00525 [Elusimicrobia bacterium RIFOXYA12_FULL_51_18]OGS28983.1 MAG: hypothetical protein A2218_08540 [Elusimicrobia bacterium RIFOXYA2_FULL_53_38]
MKLLTTFFTTAILLNDCAGAVTKVYGQQPVAAAQQTAATAAQPAKKQKKPRRRPVAAKPAGVDPRKINALLYGTAERLEIISSLYENLGLRISTDTLKKAYDLDKAVNKTAAAYFMAPEPKPDRENIKNYRGLLESVLRSVRILKELKDRLPAADTGAAILSTRDLYLAINDELAAHSLIPVAIDPKPQAGKNRASADGEEISNQTETLLTISELTLALSNFLREEGKYPTRLKDLAPKYIPAIPAVSVAGHPKTAEVVEIESRDYDADHSRAFNDTGKWLYFSHKKSRYYGRVFVDCSHKNSQGVEFYKIGEAK